MSIHNQNIKSQFEIHYTALCKKAYFYIEDIDDAKDIVQEVFLKLLDKKNLNEIKDFKSYLNRSVVNASLKWIAKQKKKKKIDHTIEIQKGTEYSIEDSIIKDESSTILNKELNNLPEKCKEIFVLCVLEDLKYQEAADTLGVSINTVKSQIKKAYKILRKSANYHSFLFLLLNKNQ